MSLEIGKKLRLKRGSQTVMAEIIDAELLNPQDRSTAETHLDKNAVYQVTVKVDGIDEPIIQQLEMTDEVHDNIDHSLEEYFTGALAQREGRAKWFAAGR